jgi:hypothetical protein
VLSSGENNGTLKTVKLPKNALIVSNGKTYKVDPKTGRFKDFKLKPLFLGDDSGVDVKRSWVASFWETEEKFSFERFTDMRKARKYELLLKANSFKRCATRNDCDEDEYCDGASENMLGLRNGIVLMHFRLRRLHVSLSM